MAGRIDLEGRDLLIRFAYDQQLVDAVRLLPGRRFDPRMKIWTVPARHVDAVVNALAPYGFDLAPEVQGLAQPTIPSPRLPFVSDDNATAAPVEVAIDTQAALAARPRAWTISTLNQRVRETLRGAFVDGVWVIGEVLDYDKSAGRVHRHFSLAERAAGEARPVAQVEVVLFGDTAAEITHKLQSAPTPLTLRDGLEIRVRARVDLYPQSGRYQLIVDDIDPEHTLGKLALSREQILSELRAKGLDRKNLVLPLPRPALRIAVLASETSDGWHDFEEQLKASGFAFILTLFPVRVQGIALRRTVLAGLAYFAARSPAFDVLCILRGGGSRTDLSWFDDRELAHAVANCPLKVLVGIGHERDRTVLDFIAHSFKTPTAIAAHLAEQAHGEWQISSEQAGRLATATANAFAGQRRQLQRRATALHSVVSGHLLAQRHALELAAQRLRHAALSKRAARARRALALAAQRLRHVIGNAIDDARTAATRAPRRLHDALARMLERTRTRLANQELKSRLLDPRTVLRRGYAMVRRSADGRIVTDAAAIVPPATLAVEFRDGFVEVEASQVTIRPPAPPTT